jgi:hypothetical protein
MPRLVHIGGGGEDFVGMFDKKQQEVFIPSHCFLSVLRLPFQPIDEPLFHIGEIQIS